jgi:hypothetical protein
MPEETTENDQFVNKRERIWKKGDYDLFLELSPNLPAER